MLKMTKKDQGDEVITANRQAEIYKLKDLNDFEKSTRYNLETNALNRKTIVERYSLVEDSAETFQPINRRASKANIK